MWTYLNLNWAIFDVNLEMLFLQNYCRLEIVLYKKIPLFTAASPSSDIWQTYLNVWQSSSFLQLVSFSCVRTCFTFKKKMCHKICKKKIKTLTVMLTENGKLFVFKFPPYLGLLTLKFSLWDDGVCTAWPLTLILFEELKRRLASENQWHIDGGCKERLCPM